MYVCVCVRIENAICTFHHIAETESVKQSACKCSYFYKLFTTVAWCSFFATLLSYLTFEKFSKFVWPVT